MTEKNPSFVDDPIAPAAGHVGDLASGLAVVRQHAPQAVNLRLGGEAYFSLRASQGDAYSAVVGQGFVEAFNLIGSETAGADAPRSGWSSMPIASRPPTRMLSTLRAELQLRKPGRTAAPAGCRQHRGGAVAEAGPQICPRLARGRRPSSKEGPSGDLG